MPFAPVARRTVTDEVRGRLRASILAGDLPPGARLPSERTLCDEFGVARTSVREAIGGLVTLGLIERRGNRAYVVEHLPDLRLAADDGEWARSLAEAHRALAGPIAELAATRATAGQRHELCELAARLGAGPAAGDAGPLDRTFHALLGSASGNPVLAEVHAKVLDALAGAPAPGPTSAEGYAAIAGAVAAGDPAVASAAVRTHLP